VEHVHGKLENFFKKGQPKPVAMEKVSKRDRRDREGGRVTIFEKGFDK
jgi:hypothetical protein